MAVAAWVVHRTPRAAVPLTAWWVQLALNLGWSWLFFGLERPGLALIEITLLIAAVAASVFAFLAKEPPRSGAHGALPGVGLLRHDAQLRNLASERGLRWPNVGSIRVAFFAGWAVTFERSPIAQR